MHNSKMQTVSDSPLCRFCSKIDIRRLLVEAKAQGPPASGSPDQVFAYDSIHAAVPKFFAHHPNLVSLRDSARDCDLCSSIWDQYTQNAHPFEYTEDALNQGLSAESIWIGAEQWVEELQGVPTIAAVQYGPRGTARRLAWFEAFAQRGLSPDTAISTIRVDTVYADDTPSEASELLGRSIHASSLSDSCLALARDWVETCSGDHSECKQYSQKSPLLPRRVVEMFRNTPDQSLIAKVVDADGQQDKYVALSYCWGGPGVIMLTRDTQQLLQDGVPVKDFPATLQDAMTATWSLGICYIWM